MAEPLPNVCLGLPFARLEAEAKPAATQPPAASADVAAFTRRLVAGDAVAWREFHDRYFDRLLRYLLVVTGGREEAAREALQLAFVRSVRYVRSFDTEPALWSWLTVLARSALVDEHRKQRRYLAFLDRLLLWRKTEQAGEDREAEILLNDSLERGLAGLADDERCLIQRKYFGGASVREIADELGATEKAVESRLARIRGKLKHAVLAQLRDEKRD